MKPRITVMLFLSIISLIGIISFSNAGQLVYSTYLGGEVMTKVMVSPLMAQGTPILPDRLVLPIFRPRLVLLIPRIMSVGILELMFL